MTSSNNLRLGSVSIDKLFEMISQEFKALERKYRVLPNFGICCNETRKLKVASFCARVRSFCSVPPVHKKVAQFFLADFENGRF